MKMPNYIGKFFERGISSKPRRLALLAWFMNKRRRWQSLDVLLGELDQATPEIQSGFTRCVIERYLSVDRIDGTGD